VTNSTESLRSVIENITSLPTLPTVAEKINQLLENPQTTAEEIGKAITTDQALTAKVLKLVNSAFYGFPGRISTITHAIVILGFSTIKNIVLTTSIFDAFRKSRTAQSQFDMEAFWLHCIACGAASQTIARATGFKEWESCFIAGLIHDIGKTILCQYRPQDFLQVIEEAATKGELFYDCERQLFDIAHPQIGALLAQRWRLPQNLLNAIEHHHAPLPSHPHYTMTAIVHSADILVRAMDYGSGGDEKIPLLSEQVWRDLHLEQSALGGLLESIDEEVSKAMVFMQLI
jgi:putative nucleotidyltransferase with HDIG domain